MRLRSKLFLGALASAAQMQGSAANAQVYEIVRSTLDDASVKRLAATQLCAASATRKFGAEAATQVRFDILGFDYRYNGDIRVYATMASDGHGAKQIRCDVDPAGSLKRLDLGTSS